MAQNVDRARRGAVLDACYLECPVYDLPSPALSYRKYAILAGDLPLVAELVQPGHQGCGQGCLSVFVALARHFGPSGPVAMQGAGR